VSPDSERAECRVQVGVFNLPSFQGVACVPRAELCPMQKRSRVGAAARERQT
jgi:hypothetical protein